MTYEYPIFPDETPVVINYLTSHPNLAAFNLARVAEDLKGYAAPMRWVSVQGTGGNMENKVRIGAPRVDINVYAESKPVAKKIALAAHAAMQSMKNYITDDAVVTNTIVSWPADLTDAVNSNPRYVFDATINIRPR